MKVKATQPGFYAGNLRKEGAEFILHEVEVLKPDGKQDVKLTKEATERQFSSKWMVKV